MTTPPRVQRGAELLAELPAMLAAAGVPDAALVTISNDARKLDTAPTRPGIVVVMPAPGLTFPAPGVVEVAWSIAVCAGPADDEVEAWARIDTLVEAFRRGGLHIVEAVPGVRPRPDNPVPLPGYTLTLAEQLDDYA